MSCSRRSLSGFSGLVYRRGCCNADEYRERANNMTIPAKGLLVLRGVPGKCLPQDSDQRKWIKFGDQRQAFSSESHFGFKIRRGFGKMPASDAANGKSRLGSLRSPWCCGGTVQDRSVRIGSWQCHGQAWLVRTYYKSRVNKFTLATHV